MQYESLKKIQLQYKNGEMLPPKIGDDRYNWFKDKKAIDLLRVMFYQKFKCDLSISFNNADDIMFYDETLECVC